MGTFDGLFQLKQLDLGFNQLDFVQTGLFKDLQNLNELDLKNNRLKWIEDYAFQSQSMLARLDLRNNNLVEFQNRTFAGLESIRFVYIALPRGVLQYAPITYHLYYDGAPITDI